MPSLSLRARRVVLGGILFLIVAPPSSAQRSNPKPARPSPTAPASPRDLPIASPPASSLPTPPAGAPLPVPALPDVPVFRLEEAFRLADQHSPRLRLSHLEVDQAAVEHRAMRRQILPTVSSDFQLGLREGRQQFFAGVPIGAGNSLISSVGGLSATAQLGLDQRQRVRATAYAQTARTEDLAAVRQQLRREVARAYLTLAEVDARLAFQDTLITVARTLLELAQQRQRIGLILSLDVQRARLVVGQQEASRVRLTTERDVAQLTLTQLLGVPVPSPARLAPPPAPDVPTAPETTEGVVRDILRHHPALRAEEARIRVAEAQRAASRAAYWPSLALNAAVNGVTQRFIGTVPPEQAAAQQGAFPLGFRRQPYTVGAAVSLPLLNGLQRRQALEQARVAEDQAGWRLTEQMLRVETEVRTALVRLRAEQESRTLQREQRDVAGQALQVALARYRAGLDGLTDITLVRREVEEAALASIGAEFAYLRLAWDLELLRAAGR